MKFEKPKIKEAALLLIAMLIENKFLPIFQRTLDALETDKLLNMFRRVLSNLEINELYHILLHALNLSVAKGQNGGSNTMIPLAMGSVMQDEPMITYDKPAQSLCFEGKRMKLNKGKMHRILKALGEPRRIEWILGKFYNQNCKNVGKIHDNKRNTFDVAVQRLNKKWQKAIKRDYELITSDNEGTYSLAVEIKWQ